VNAAQFLPRQIFQLGQLLFEMRRHFGKDVFDQSIGEMMCVLAGSGKSGSRPRMGYYVDQRGG
jgi:hypothetical protein